MTQRVLMIVTSCNRMGESGKPTGIWAEELAVPYYAFRDAGLEVDIASPKGGPVPLDPGSVQPEGKNEPAVERFLQDAEAQRQVQATLPTAAVDPARYDAVFLPGGHGTMWDLPDDAGVRRIVESLHAAGKVVGAVCHGPAGLVAARTADGRSILEGRHVTAFTDKEEREAGLAETVPFLLESRIRELGARFECANAWQSFAVRDGQLVTGQNPQSSALVARHVLEALCVA